MLQSLNTIEADKIPQTKAIGHFGFRCSRAKISDKIVHFPRSLGWCAISIDELVCDLIKITKKVPVVDFFENWGVLPDTNRLHILMQRKILYYYGDKNQANWYFSIFFSVEVVDWISFLM